MSSSETTMIIRRIAAAGLALLFCAHGALAFVVESGRGFPDGHITDYGRWVHGPRIAIAWGCFALAVAAGVVALPRSLPRAMSYVAIGVLAALFVALAALDIAGLRFIGVHQMGLEDGWGG